MSDASGSSAEHAYRATQIIHRYTVYAAGATALWPTPLWPVSSPAVTALQLQLLSALAAHYNVPFSRAKFTPLVASLGGGVLSYGIGQMPWSIAVKAWLLTVPVIGVPLRFASGPIVLAAYTYALGRAFASHLAQGRDADSFDMREVRTEALRLWKESPSST
jgi:uncharacterized protein (DUF697 family)